MSFRTKLGTALKETYESLGVEGTAKVLRELLEDGSMRPEDCSLKEIRESVNTSDFPVIVGEVVNSAVMRGFDSLDTIGDQLCTTVTSKLKIDKIVGFQAVEMPDEIVEGGDYSDSSMDEKYVTSQNAKFGKLLSVTEEAVFFDQTRQVLARAQRIGEKAALHRERSIVYGVQDISGYRSYFPSNQESDLFQATLGNAVESAPFGEAGLTKVFGAIHDMTDEQGDPIFIPSSQAILLVPIDLWVEARQMSDSVKTPEGMENAVNVFRGMMTVLSSPFVSNQSATTWYYGDPKRAFLWTEVWPLQTFTQKQESDDLFTRDLAARYKVRYFGNITCAMPEYWFRATA